MAQYPLPTNLPPELRDIPAEVWVYADDTWAGFVPSEGFNCTALRILRDGIWQPILSEPPSWEAIRGRPSWYGMPILAPWVFGMAEDTLRFQGQCYPVAPGKEGHANHGFSRDYAWHVDAHQQNEHSATLCGSLTAGPDDDASRALLAHFPWPVRLSVTYTLRPGELVTTLTITNLADESIPVGGGFHPYVDLSPRSSCPDDALTVHARMRRLTDREPELVGDWGYGDDPAAFAMKLGEVIPQLTDGVRMGDLFRRDDELGDAPLVWRLDDAARGLSIAFVADPSLGFISQFLPPDRTTFSPVFSSMRHGGHGRAEDGLDSGLVVLEPGQSWHAEIRIGVG